MIEFYTSNFNRARKEYKCDLCGQTININEKYHRYSGKYDGEMFDNKYHIECQEIIDKFCDENGDAEYNNDWITDWLNNKYCYGCIHGTGNQGDCDNYTITCPLIREQLLKEQNSIIDSLKPKCSNEMPKDIVCNCTKEHKIYYRETDDEYEELDIDEHDKYIIEFISDKIIYPLLDECDIGLWEHISYIPLAEKWVEAIHNNPYLKVKNHNEARKKDLKKWIAEQLEDQK